VAGEGLTVASCLELLGRRVRQPVRDVPALLLGEMASGDLPDF
jgi:hypothetical protein